MPGLKVLQSWYMLISDEQALSQPLCKIWAVEWKLQSKASKNIPTHYKPLPEGENILIYRKASVKPVRLIDTN